MNQSDPTSPKHIRLVFELERADNPRLYDDLIRFKKGTKRVNRLRTLAHEGLLAQHWPLTGGRFVEVARGDMLHVDAAAASVTNQIFDDPLME